MGNVPRRMEALVRAVLAHGTDPNTVRQRDATDLERREQLRDRLA